MEGVRDAFVCWVDNHLLQARSLPSTAMELYAARCGILHTFSADRTSSTKEKFGGCCMLGAPQKSAIWPLQYSAELGRDDGVAIHVEDLFWASRVGLWPITLMQWQ